MIAAGTGHRFKTLGYESKGPLEEFAVRVLARHRPTGIISGMALGWDQALAVAAVKLGIPFVAAVPFEGQEKIWPPAAQREYRDLLTLASTVTVVCQFYEHDDSPKLLADAYQTRNEWMVDNSTHLLALWNGDRKGGTYNCVRYAQEGRREIIQLWDEWGDWIGGGYLI